MNRLSPNPVRAGSDFGHDARYHRPEPSRPIQRRRRRRGWKRVALLALRVVAVGGLGGAAWAAGTRAASSSLFDIRRVVIEGTRRARPDALQRAVRSAGSGNLFRLDLAAVRRRLETDPWVRTADVRRRLPDTIAVTIAERQPAGVALAEGRAMLVDEEGVPLAECGTLPEPCAFPVLTGLDGLDPADRKERVVRGVAACREVERIAPELARTISEVDLAAPERLRVLRDGGGAALLLSPEEPGRNLRNFATVEAEILERFERVDWVDLRFRGRIAVMPGPGAAPDGAGARR